MKEKKSNIEKHTVACPHCGKPVLDHMTVCPHCKGELKSAYYDTTNMDSPARKKWRIIFLVIAVAIFIAVAVIRAAVKN